MSDTILLSARGSVMDIAMLYCSIDYLSMLNIKNIHINNINAKVALSMSLLSQNY